MVDTPLRLTPEDAQHPWWPYTNPIARLLRGVNTGGIILRGDLGTRRDLTNPNTETTGNYTLDVQSKATGGLHAAFVLSGTSATAAPTAVNSAVLIQDSGLILGTTARLDLETIRVYESGRVDYSQITSSNGELNLGGSGASAGGLSVSAALRVLSGTTVQLFNPANTLAGTLSTNAAGTIEVSGSGGGNMLLAGNPSWLSGTSFAITLDHAATAARTVTFPDATATVAMLAFANAGALLFVDNTHDIGASGATRPRTLYLGTSLDVAAGAQLLTASDVTLTAPWTTFSPGLTQNGARTLTVNYARYRIFGKLAIVQIQLTCTNAGTAGNVVQITGIPAAIQPARTGNDSVCGTFLVLDTGTAYYHGAAVMTTTTTVEGWIHTATTNTIGVNPSFALANGDKVSCQLAYEIA